MEPAKFEGYNCVYAENQDQYLDLPVLKTEEGLVVSCWKMSWKERVKFLFTGKLWLTTMTFNEKLQPLKPSVDYPFEKAEK